MNNNIIVIRKKSQPYKYVTWDRIAMIFKPNYNNISHPTDINIEKCEMILSQGHKWRKLFIWGKRRILVRN